MSNYRAEVSRKNNYYIPSERTMELTHFCKQYPIWKKAYESLDGLSKRPADLEIFNRNHGVSDPTAKCAIAKERYSELMGMVDEAAKRADAELARYILLGAIEGLSYERLCRRYSVPCCREVYYNIKRKFFWELSQLRK